MAKDAIYEVSREVKTYVELDHAANVLIKKTEQDEKGSTYTTMCSLLLTAFTFEAYLNHLGEFKLNLWDNNDRTDVLDKYIILCKKFEIVSDTSKRPYQTLKCLFRFRNLIAHGRSEELVPEPKEVSSQNEMHTYAPKTKIEEYCQLENAKRAKEDITKLITELHEQAGFGCHPFVSGMTHSSLTLKSQESNKINGNQPDT